MSQNEITLETDLNYIREQLKTVDHNSSDNRYAKALYALDRIHDVIKNNNPYDKTIKGNYFNLDNQEINYAK
jgi:hypothetical protein